MHRNADGILQAVHHRPFAHDLRNRHGPSATADMIVGGGGGMSNPFSRGGWIASLIGTAASRTPADARTQVTIGAAAGAYVDGIAAARAAGFSYAGSNLGGRTAFAVVDTCLDVLGCRLVGCCELARDAGGLGQVL